MAAPFSRRRSSEPSENSKKEKSVESTPGLVGHAQTTSYRPLVFLLILLSFWSTSMFLSGSVFHFCFSSRMFNVYCISGGRTGRNVGLAGALNHGQNENVTLTTAGDSNSSVAVEKNKGEEKANAVRVVEEQLRIIRSWSSSSSKNYNTTSTKNNCDGRGVFVYDLPKKFNYDLVVNCHVMVPWLCKYMKNNGMGEPIPALGDGWYGTHQYSLEPIFHNRILNHPCRVLDPDDAALFYVPFYGGLEIMRWNLYKVSDDMRDRVGRELDQWLQGQKPWDRSRGTDHVFVLGNISWNFRRSGKQNWGNNFLQIGNLSNSFKLLIERQPWEIKEIGIPYPTYFHPKSDAEIEAWQAKAVGSNRTTLVSFAGAARSGSAGSVRSLLIEQCKSTGRGHCRLIDCSSDKCLRHEMVISTFLGSEFCLQPAGDSPTRKSVFDSLLTGCIPVLFDPFTAYYQYPWHLPEDHRKYSIYIDQEELKNEHIDVIQRLRNIPVKQRDEMRRYIMYELMPGLVYGDPTSKFYRFKDAFDIVMENLMEAVRRSNV